MEPRSQMTTRIPLTTVCRLLSCALAVAAIPAAAASPSAKAGTSETAILAGGCFWGVEAVFEHVRGVRSVVSGYAGGTSGRIGGSSGGGNGFAEAVRIQFDPAQISYQQLLEIYFRIAHDPTEVDRQGPDVGSRYRSAIFPQTAGQRRIAADVIARLRSSRAFARPIATRIESGGFKTAEAGHQDYVRRNPGSRYVVINDLPKLVRLKRSFPTLWKA